MPLESDICKSSPNRKIDWYTREQIINIDETNYAYEIGPTYIYVPKDSDRAYGEKVGDEKAGFTVMVGVSAKGDFLPSMIILEHSAARLDETSMTAVTNWWSISF